MIYKDYQTDLNSTTHFNIDFFTITIIKSLIIEILKIINIKIQSQIKIFYLFENLI